MHLLMSIQCSSRPSIERDCPSLQEEQGTSTFIGPSPCRKPASAASTGTWRFERDQKCFDRCVQVCGSPAVQHRVMSSSIANCHYSTILSDDLRDQRHAQSNQEEEGEGCRLQGPLKVKLVWKANSLTWSTEGEAQAWKGQAAAVQCDRYVFQSAV
jgi:hypothetical protein